MESAKTSLSNILNLNTRSPYIIAGYLQFQAKKITYTIGNFPAYIINKISELNSIVEENDIQGILFTSQKDILSERNRLVNYCLENSIKMFTIPPINQWQHKTATLRELNIDDLLGRSEIKVNPEEISKNLNQKTVLVTGAAGSIGSELCRQIASWNVSKLILLDSCETGMHNLRLELEENFPNLNFIPIIGDVRSPERINFVFSKHHP
ncbi:MAG: polysaccharide biosynthesis protein, partial [Bacteroidales bacterium]